MYKNFIAMFISVLFIVGALHPAVVRAEVEPTDLVQETSEILTIKEERKNQRLEEARKNIETRRQTGMQKTSEVRLAACERRVENLNKIMARFTSQAERHQAVIDSIYERVQGFYNDGQLSLVNYDELNANVAAARQESLTEVEALTGLNVEQDCSDPDAVLVSVGAYRETVNSTKEALKNYRMQLVALISALKSAQSGVDEEVTQ